MHDQKHEVGGDKSFNQSWGFGTGSVSSELQSAAKQMAVDARLPNSDVSVLLEQFFPSVFALAIPGHSRCCV